MRFPRKFQRMLEIQMDDVVRPDEVLLTYAVCACFHDSCAWHGWIVCSAPGSLDTSLSHAAGLIEIAACHA